MKTIGINSSEQLNSLRNKDEQTQIEVYMKGMINSCFTYGGYEKGSHNFKQYIEKYRNQLGEQVFEEVYAEQVKYLTEKCEVIHNTFTDSEGLSYNSLIEK
jgi:hypothetical protein